MNFNSPKECKTALMVLQKQFLGGGVDEAWFWLGHATEGLAQRVCSDRVAQRVEHVRMR